MATGWLLLFQQQTFESKMALKQWSEVEEITCLGSTFGFEETLSRVRGMEYLLILETSLLWQVTFALGSLGKRALHSEGVTWCHTYKPGCCTSGWRHWEEPGTSSTSFISSQVTWSRSLLLFLENLKLGLIPPLAGGVWSSPWLYIFLSVHGILSIRVLPHKSGRAWMPLQMCHTLKICALHKQFFSMY